jgi:hypothetical protein
MTDNILDFPKDELPEDEISKKEAPIRRPPRPRGKSILGKFLFMILVAAIIIGGILYIQQSLLDLEAQAQVYALQTAVASSRSTLASFPQPETTPTAEIVSTPTSEIVPTITTAVR